MAFDWREYHQLASNLAGRSTPSPTEQAALRAAVSRGYYATYWIVRAYVEEFVRPIGRYESVHEVIPGRIRRINHPDADIMADAFEGFVLQRTRADYKAEVIFTSLGVQTLLDEMSDVIAWIEGLPRPKKRA